MTRAEYKESIIHSYCRTSHQTSFIRFLRHRVLHSSLSSSHSDRSSSDRGITIVITQNFVFDAPFLSKEWKRGSKFVWEYNSVYDDFVGLSIVSQSVFFLSVCCYCVLNHTIQHISSNNNNKSTQSAHTQHQRQHWKQRSRPASIEFSVIKWRHSLFDSQTVNDGYLAITEILRHRATRTKQDLRNAELNQKRNRIKNPNKLAKTCVFSFTFLLLPFSSVDTNS